MLLQDLFEKIEPGERKAIQLQIDKYQQSIKDIEKQEYTLASLDQDDYKIAGAEKELEDLKQAYQKYVDDLKAKLSSNKKEVSSFDRYMEAIVRHCPTIVNMCKKTNKLLYRGTKEDAPAFYGRPFDTREAKDSSREVHDAWNYAMDQAGAAAKRDNSIFTTTNQSFAGEFGRQVYIVFFRDPFNFTWSEKEKDLVLDSSKMIDMVNPETIKKIMGYVWQDDVLREEYKTTYRYIRMISPETPVDFDPNTYPANDTYEIFYRYNFKNSFDAFVNIAPKLPSEFQKYTSFNNWVDPQTIITNFGMHIDEDLEGAFRQGHEITIRSNYYAIRSDFEMKVKKYLDMTTRYDDVDD